MLNTPAAAQNTDPAWFSNPKRRTIPNHLVPKKKSAFQITPSSSSKKDSKTRDLLASTSNPTEFNLLSFGSNQRRSLAAGQLDRSASVGSAFDAAQQHYDETINDTFHEDLFYTNNDDLPPARSIYDLNDEVLISLNKPASLHADSFINKDPKAFNNVFNKDGQNSAKNTQNEPENLKKTNPLDHSEAAVLVFGYPEAMANQVISHFQEFGSILEDFDVTKRKTALVREPTHSKPIAPIFSGKSWVKITYDNPSLALDALQENGSVFNGVLLGVIPYTKNSIEKLQKRKLTATEDIGGGIDLASGDKAKKLDAGENDIQASYVNRMDIKDGASFFLKANANDSKSNPDKKNDEKLGLVGSALKFFFGFHEL